jgi:transposase
MADQGRGGYPSNVTDEEWAFVLPYLLLCREDSPRREHELRTVFNAVRYVARMGGHWRFLPHDLPPWYVVYQQLQRWLKAGCFELLVAAIERAGGECRDCEREGSKTEPLDP